MGRRKLLPNINNLLLQLHLPHRNNGGEANESKKVPEDSSSPKEGAHFQHNNTTTHHHQHHHNLHIFTWPSLKRRPSSSSLASNSSEDDHSEIHHDTDSEPAACCSNPTPMESSSSRQITSTSNNSNDSLHSNSHSNSHKSVVSFGNCEVRKYTQVLGDHPCCSEGCPIQLGWSYTCEESIKVDDYERVYHTVNNTVNSQEEGNDTEQSVTMQKYTVLHELRLTPEERRSILILSKQQEYVNATNASASDSEEYENDENDNGDSNCDSLSAANTCKDQPATPTTPTTSQNHERELMRECRRLNRCGGWNVNVKASRKRNKRTQEAFFGCPVTTRTRIPSENAEL